MALPQQGTETFGSDLMKYNKYSYVLMALPQQGTETFCDFCFAHDNVLMALPQQGTETCWQADQRESTCCGVLMALPQQGTETSA